MGKKFTFDANEIQEMGAKICQKYYDKNDDDNACHNCPFDGKTCITSHGEFIYWQEQDELFIDHINNIQEMVHKIIKEAADD